jgi:hypothetical protein
LIIQAVFYLPKSKGISEMETDPTPTPADDGQTPPAVLPVSPPADTGTQTAEEVKAELERVRKALKDANKEAADRRKKLEALEAAEKERADKELTETERLQKKLAEIQQQAEQATQLANQRLVRQAIVTQAARLNFADPEDAYDKLKNTQFEIEGETVTGVEDAVKKLAERSKHLLKSNNPNLSTFNPAGGGIAVETDAQKRARIYGSGGGIFDVSRAEQNGGGVVWPKGQPET